MLGAVDGPVGAELVGPEPPGADGPVLVPGADGELLRAVGEPLGLVLALAEWEALAEAEADAEVLDPPPEPRAGAEEEPAPGDHFPAVADAVCRTPAPGAVWEAPPPGSAALLVAEAGPVAGPVLAAAGAGTPGFWEPGPVVPASATPMPAPAAATATAAPAASRPRHHGRAACRRPGAPTVRTGGTGPPDAPGPSAGSGPPTSVGSVGPSHAAAAAGPAAPAAAPAPTPAPAPVRRPGGRPGPCVPPGVTGGTGAVRASLDGTPAPAPVGDPDPQVTRPAPDAPIERSSPQGGTGGTGAVPAARPVAEAAPVPGPASRASAGAGAEE